MDKWQQREVERYARDNGVTEDEALAVLHPDVAGVNVAPEAEAEVPGAEVDDPAEGESAAPSAKVSTVKGARK